MARIWIHVLNSTNRRVFFMNFLSNLLQNLAIMLQYIRIILQILYLKNLIRNIKPIFYGIINSYIISCFIMLQNCLLLYVQKALLLVFIFYHLERYKIAFRSFISKRKKDICLLQTQMDVKVKGKKRIVLQEWIWMLFRVLIP